MKDKEEIFFVLSKEQEKKLKRALKNGLQIDGIVRTTRTSSFLKMVLKKPEKKSKPKEA